ncbi:hypothetical protein J1605_020804 [Eschrichtius robustus]|uniref:Sodium-dependent dopamine transporter n=1 Tax=Eschrichtius robustus TaxID=9764 RepID=A0AB34HKR8_ESCRO|nr:hypothetical protein J1605_020804 [Eschrichtius robustus]
MRKPRPQPAWERLVYSSRDERAQRPGGLAGTCASATLDTSANALGMVWGLDARSATPRAIGPSSRGGREPQAHLYLGPEAAASVPRVCTRPGLPVPAARAPAHPTCHPASPTPSISPTGAPPGRTTRCPRAPGRHAARAGGGLPLEACCLEDFLDKSASGTGLAFIIFTEAVLHMPGAPVWAVLFFGMLFSPVPTSMFGNVESVITPRSDLVGPQGGPDRRPSSTRLEGPDPAALAQCLKGLACLLCFLSATCFTLRSGNDWLETFDRYVASLDLTLFAFSEVVGVIYVYGMKRFCDDIAWMTGRRPGLYWQVTWKVVRPLLLLTIFVAYVALLASSPRATRPGTPSTARKTLTVDIRARRATWAAFALRPQIPRSPMSPGATVPIPADPVTLGKGLSQWREDRSSFQTPVTSQVPEAPPTGTRLQATLPKCRGDGLCKRPAGSQTRAQPGAKSWLESRGPDSSQLLAPGCALSRLGPADLPAVWWLGAAPCLQR